MYAQGTVLVKKKQKAPEIVKGPDKKIVNEETGEVTYEETKIEKPFPYNRVVVVGPSFINHPTNADGEWQGGTGQGVILQPGGEAFGRTLVEPISKIQELYNVEFVPEVLLEAPPIRVRDAYTAASGPTPEEFFKAEASGPAPKKGQTRGRTPHTASPLESTHKPVSASPLD